MEVDKFIQNKLIYIFDRKVEQLFENYFEYLEGQPNNEQKLSLLKQINELEFENFKFKATISSAKRDYELNNKLLSESGTIKLKQKIIFKKLRNKYLS